MTRVCMVAYTNYQFDTRIRREAEALVERGDSVDLICLGSKGESNPEFLNGVRMIKIFLPRYRGSNGGMYIASYLYFFWVALFKLTWMHIKKPYQLFQVHTMPDFMVFTTIIPKLFGAKVILDVHDLMPELYQSKFGANHRNLKIRLITWMERLSIGFAHKAIAVHQPHLDILCQHGNPSQKFTVLMNLPDPKIFTVPKDCQPPDHPGLRMIYHGVLVKRNGLETAIRAVSSLKNDLKSLKLKIIGSGDDTLQFRELVNELDLKDSVEVIDALPIDKIVPMIMDADVGIVPILDNEFTKYGLPVKLLEYVIMGKPVICSKTSTIAAYFNEKMVRFVTAGSVPELAAAIRELYEHPEIRASLSQGAAKFSQSYNWDKQKQTYYQLVDSLVKPPHKVH